jgi:hypothetical protein
VSFFMNKFRKCCTTSPRSKRGMKQSARNKFCDTSNFEHIVDRHAEAVGKRCSRGADSNVDPSRGDRRARAGRWRPSRRQYHRNSQRSAVPSLPRLPSLCASADTDAHSKPRATFITQTARYPVMAIAPVGSLTSPNTRRRNPDTGSARAILSQGAV